MKRFILIVIVVLSTSLSGVFPQNGVLDTTFGTNGFQEVTINESPIGIQAMAVQQDSKILVANYGYVMRFNANGTKDKSFGNNGYIISPVSSDNYSINLQADNKFLIAGWPDTGGNILARYDTNGSLDPSFGVGGVVYWNSRPKGFDSLDEIRSVLHSSGKITVSLKFTNNTNEDTMYLLLRFNSNGSKDLSFGVDGEFSWNPAGTDGLTLAMAADSNDKLFLSVNEHEYTFGFPREFGGDYIVRLTSAGGLDSSFGTNGIRYLNSVAEVTNGTFSCWRVLSSGEILLSYNFMTDLGNRFSKIVKLTNNGSLDLNFGTTGVINVNEYYLNYSSYFIHPFLWGLPNGKIITGGISGNSRNLFSMTCLNPNGTKDTTFGTNGTVTTALGYDTHFFIEPDFQLPNTITVGFNTFFSVSGGWLLRYTMGSSLNTASNFIDDSFKLYPIPIRDGSPLKVDFTLSGSEKVSVDLLDVSGKVISNLMKDEFFSHGNNQMELVVPAHLSKGVYFLNINSDSGTKVFKIVK
ncbi:MULTISPECIES: T9SS type A sorting domain-containing protein [Flavobacterium]|uniref:T9SS type A sorting domain-containing protein n=1 Tax=Flavobacterium TaxID=237 RepID=UPI001FCC2E6D|nr:MULTISPECIES: T9SS type A sorting domain-containing protein [Flavobacterium]UOK41143.1 T9SS type A sorting domain-containing protein [Flavobacterium enshiense]